MATATTISSSVKPCCLLRLIIHKPRQASQWVVAILAEIDLDIQPLKAGYFRVLGGNGPKPFGAIALHGASFGLWQAGIFHQCLAQLQAGKLIFGDPVSLGFVAGITGALQLAVNQHQQRRQSQGHDKQRGHHFDKGKARLSVFAHQFASASSFSSCQYTLPIMSTMTRSICSLSKRSKKAISRRLLSPLG